MKYVIKNGKTVPLPTLPVTNCDGCGACCLHMGTPPGYAAFYPTDGEIPEDWKDGEDYRLWLALPPEVEAELRAYYDGVKAGTLYDRSHGYVTVCRAAELIKEGALALAAEVLRKSGLQPIPCLWYDAASKKCKHYDHRPTTCREAIAPGDDGCLATRRRFRIPLPTA